MFPDRLLTFDRVAGSDRIVPRWLSPRDEPWLRELAAELDAVAGVPSGAADERIIDTVAPKARPYGVGRRVVEAVWLVERRRFRRFVDAPVSPVRIRRVLFDLAAERSREEALATAASELGMKEEAMLQALFADREKERKLGAPRDSPDDASEALAPNAIAERYNLALVQSLLVRSKEIIATVSGHARVAVRFAKLLGLMVTFDEDAGERLRLTISGPLALFHETTKYGHALARFLPALTATPAWGLESRILIGGESFVLKLDATAPVARAHALPPSTDSKLEARLERDLRRLGLGYRLERESCIVRLGTRLFFPDFTLAAVDGHARVAIEVAGFWTPEYLRSKLALLHAAKLPFVLCVDGRHERMVERMDARLVRDIVFFRDHVDAAALVAACERASRPAPAHWITVPESALLRRYAVAAGAAVDRWREDLFADLCGEDGSLCLAVGLDRGCERPTARLFVRGARFAADVVADRTRSDALFVRRVMPSRNVEPIAKLEVNARLLLRGADASPSEVEHDPVAPLLARARDLTRRSLAELAAARPEP